MTAVACKLYEIYARREYALPVLRTLHQEQIFEPEAPVYPVDSSIRTAIDVQLAAEAEEYQKAIDILTPLSGKNVPASKVADAAEIKQLFARREALLAEAKLTISLNASLAEVRKAESVLAEEKTRLVPFGQIDLPILGTHAFVDVVLLRLNPSQQKLLQRAWGKSEPIGFFAVHSSLAGLVAVVTLKQHSDKLRSILTAQQLEPLKPSTLVEGDSPAEAVKLLSKQIDERGSDITALQQNLDSRCEKLDAFRGVLDIIHWEREHLASLDYVGYFQFLPTVELDNSADGTLDSVVELRGWVDPERVGELKAILREVDPMAELSPGRDSALAVRTVLKNNWFFRPFQFVTSLMGTPHPTEVDPSPYLAPFFLLFFGFALGDAGYGIVMMAVSLYLLSRQPAESAMRDPLKLVLFCGIATTFMGALLGGWFGAQIDGVGGAFGEFLRSMRVIDPLDPAFVMVLLGLCLGIGLLHQLFGVFLAVMGSVRQGKIAEGLWGPGTWLLLMFSLLYAFALSQLGDGFVLAGTGNVVVLIAVVLFAWGQGRGTKSVFLRPLIGIASLFDITGYLSNTLSYARLLALGLATAIIAGVVNSIATLASGPEPGIVGWIIMAIVLVIGHLFNIAMNLLGTFVNVSRLQLVEFFPKFFGAKGIEFRPLRINQFYLKLKSGIRGKDLSLTEI